RARITTTLYGSRRLPLPPTTPASMRWDCCSAPKPSKGLPSPSLLWSLVLSSAICTGKIACWRGPCAVTDQITTINPANGQELRSYPAMNAEMIERYLDEAVMSQTRWRSVPIDKRVDVLRRVAEALRTRSAEPAAIATA